MIEIRLKIKEENTFNLSKTKEAVKMNVNVKERGFFPTNNEKHISRILMKRLTKGKKFDIINETSDKDYDELETILKSLFK